MIATPAVEAEGKGACVANAGEADASFQTAGGESRYGRVGLIQ